MKKIKYFIYIFIIFLVPFFLFYPENLPDNSSFNDFMKSNPEEDVVIVFNSGGWGDTAPEQAKDLTPIIDGITYSLKEKGYDSMVIPYERTKKGLTSKISGAKEMFDYFQKQSAEVAAQVEQFLSKNPGKKIILVGLSNGASFVDETMKKINNWQGNVLAVEIGSPFWHKELSSENILRLDNGEQDSLTEGQVSILLPTLLKGPAKWFLAKISGMNISFSNAFAFPDHNYSWESPNVGPTISSFLNKKI